MTLLMVALGAAVGAPARYLTDRAVQSRHDSVMPWAVANVVVSAGAALAAVVVGYAVSAALTG
jgi:fluoride exporter